MKKVTRLEQRPLKARAAEKLMTGFTVLQITDCHIGNTENDDLLGMDTDASLYDVLGHMRRYEKPDLLLVTGDISKDGGINSYYRFLDIVKRYFPNAPLAWLAGNHDIPENMTRSVASVAPKNARPIEDKHTIGGWHFILLNSCIPGKTEGELGKSELLRLQAEIEAHPNESIAIFLHHQPVAVNCKWVDAYVLADDRTFFDTIDAYDNVKLVSWGHIHQHFEAERRGVQLMSTPSTCVQFSPRSDKFSVDSTMMPGYRKYEFMPDGSYLSAVKRIDPRPYNIDEAAAGY